MVQKAQQIAKGIYAVGAVDKTAAQFHGYTVHNGVTYNAYLTEGDNGNYTLIDTVHASKADELIARIETVTPLEKIEAIIVNHTEPDHSGALPVLLQRAQPKLFATTAAAKLLKGMYGIENVCTVKNGDQTVLGGRMFRFVATPMVHWPDNMVTYEVNEEILFSNDAFGQHYATHTPLDSMNDVCLALREAQHYFANIVMPYRAQAGKAAEAALSLPLKMIAPSHGVIWTGKNIDRIARLYRALCGDEADGATLAFDSLWGGTAARAKAAEEELRKRYAVVHTFDLRSCALSDVISALSSSRHVCIGSPTYNGFPTPHVGALLAEIEALKPPVREYSVFGTYAWGGGAAKKISEKLDALGYEKIFDFTAPSF